MEKTRIDNLSVKGLNISVKTLGEGKPLLILHGWGSRAERWERVAELLPLKVVMPDLPGFGDSQEPKTAWSLDDYCAFVEEFVKTQPELVGGFHLLGHSFGGALAAKFTIKNPEKIKRLFLVSSSCIRKRTLKKTVLSFVSKIVSVFSFLSFYEPLRKAFYRFIVRSDYLSVKGVMKESYLKVIKDDLSNYLHLIKAPTVIIWGEEDDVTPLNQARIINKEIKDSKLVLIPGVGHNIEIKTPEKLADILLNNGV